MDLRPTDEQQQLVAAFSSLYTREAMPVRVREAEPSGFHKGLWERLTETGAVAMAVGEEHGGWGASLLDLALVAEQQGRFVAPAPVIETQVAARLLSRLPGGAASDALTSAVAGDSMVTLAVRPARDGTATLVPAGAVADAAIVLSGDRLLLVPLGDGQRLVANSGCLPLADVAVTQDAVVLTEGADALAFFESALTEWMTLTANAVAGIALRALEIIVPYAKERHAFGRPIGSFQGIAHRLADRAAECDGALLLAREAAWADAEEPHRSTELAAMAFAFAADTARDTTYNALHFHGGYGFMLEYDVQLYFRRARAWAGVLAEPRAAYRRVADARYTTQGA